jgi:patatin-like phospholipase/acyl hydrolase
MSFKYKVLSIDGGGIRGMIPAKILAEIEKRTGKPICQLFDLIAGTSTGGILGLALSKPDPKNKTQPHYTANDINRNIKSDDFLYPKFPSKGRDRVLEEYLQDTLLKNALTNIFVTSYDIELRTPVFFINNPHRQKLGENFRQLCDGYTMKQAGMATSAAPTYFEPYKIDTIDKTENGYYALIDGGVFANNPTNLAIMEALIASKQSGEVPLQLNEILVVSLGTGSLIRKYLYEDAKNWGLIKWVAPLINVVLDSGSESVACQLEQLLPVVDGYPQQYYRFQAPLSEANDDMDDATPRNIQELKNLGDLIIRHEDTALDKLCHLLTN